MPSSTNLCNSDIKHDNIVIDECGFCCTTGLQVTGTELLSSAVDSNGPTGPGPITSSTRYWALWPGTPWLLHTFRHITTTSTFCLFGSVVCLYQATLSIYQSRVQCCRYQSQLCLLHRGDPQKQEEDWFLNDTSFGHQHHMFDCTRSTGSSCSSHSPLRNTHTHTR